MMKIIYTILSFLAIKANATNYYVSNAGSDGNNGTTTGTSWQTIAKVNGFTFASGDSILLKCGDTWNERIIIPNSNIIFSSYGTGNKPLITAFQALGGFSQSGNVWTSTATNAVTGLNTLMLNGTYAIKARYPNSGYLTFTSYSGDSILNTSLTGTPSYVGKQIVVRTTTWVIDITRVLTQSTGQLKVSPKLTYTPAFLGNGYFFQNDVSFIDSLTEYSFDSTNKSLSVYSVATPTVQISTIDTLVWIRNKTGVTFNNIKFTGANKRTFQLDTCNNIIIQNCTINYAGANGISARKSHHVSVLSDSLLNIYNEGVAFHSDNPNTPMPDTCNYPTITDNYFKNIATVAGMGGSGDGRYMGIYSIGDSQVIKRNTFDSIGYIAVYWTGKYSRIERNYVTNFGFVKTDVAALYTWLGVNYAANYDSGSVVRKNIVYNGIGNPNGISGNNITNGIYMDNLAGYITIDSNTVSQTLYAGIFVHLAHDLIIRGNILSDSIGIPFKVEGTSVQSYNLTLRGNQYYQKKSTTDVVKYDATNTPQTSDSNYYLRPSATTNVIHYASTFYTYPETFRSVTGYDLNGGITPSPLRYSEGLLLYNPATTDNTVTLNGSYLDVYNHLYTNSITVSANGGVLLFKASWNVTGQINSIMSTGVR